MTKVVKTLEVTEISEIFQDKNGRDYKKVTLKGSSNIKVVDEDTGEISIIKIKAPERSVNSYQESYLDNKPDGLWNLSVGDKVMGAVESRQVEQAYDIEGRTVSSYSMVVLGDTSRPDWEAFVNKEFYRAGHRVAGDETDYGKPIERKSVVAETVEVEAAEEEAIATTQPAKARF